MGLPAGFAASVHELAGHLRSSGERPSGFISPCETSIAERSTACDSVTREIMSRKIR
jgi:hypothetical protein